MLDNHSSHNLVSMSEYSVSSHLVKCSTELEPEWLDLQKRADCSFYQSWGWIKAWLDQIAVDLQITAVKVWSDGTLIAIGLFVSKNIIRRHIVRSRSLFLNEYPFNERNMVTEYNGLLIQRGYESVAYENTVRHLLQKQINYDEFHFGAVAEGSGIETLANMPGHLATIVTNEISASHFIRLDRFELGFDAFLATLSRNRRGQIRRCKRLYEKSGPLRLKTAQNLEEALSFLSELKAVHMKRHGSKGEKGAFANSRWEDFHRSLIKSRFENGEIQLLKVGNSTSTLGYMYNLIWRKHVYVVQTGFSIPDDKRFMPGYITHALAVVYNKSIGMDIYDLMYGDSVYKRVLCDSSVNICWKTVQRRKLKYEFERMLVDLARKLRAFVRVS